MGGRVSGVIVVWVADNDRPKTDESSTASTPQTERGSQARHNRRKLDGIVRVLGAVEVLTVSGTKYERAGAVAARQRGRVSRAQLLAAGITPAMADHLIKARFLVRRHRGVYAVGHLAPVELARETEALLACPDGGVLSHRSAAAVWKLLPYDDAGPVDVTVLGSAGQGRHRGVRVHRTGRLDSQDVRVHQGLPVTSPARTLLDNAGELTNRELERALDEALVQRLVRLDEILDVVERHRQRPGARRLRALVAVRRESTLTRSELEELFLELIRKAGLPPPKVNYRLHDFTVDFYWPEQRVAFELDGYRFHSTRSAFERDRRKDRILKQVGVDMNRVTYWQVTREPFAVVAQVTQRLTIRDRDAA